MFFPSHAPLYLSADPKKDRTCNCLISVHGKEGKCMLVPGVNEAEKRSSFRSIPIHDGKTCFIRNSLEPLSSATISRSSYHDTWNKPRNRRCVLMYGVTCWQVAKLRVRSQTSKWTIYEIHLGRYAEVLHIDPALHFRDQAMRHSRNCEKPSRRAVCRCPNHRSVTIA